jgi:class 3 adenylate cyclase/Tfp pilus assembly protein PilF
MLTYKTSFFLVLFLFTIQVVAQDKTLDSLKAVLSKQKEDTNKVNTLVQITMSLAQSSPEEAINYGTQATVLANQLKFQKAEALALKFTGIGYYFQSKNVETLDYWLRALAVYKAIGDKSGEANILNNIGAFYFSKSDDAKALEYSLQSLNIAEEIKDTLRIASALTNIGNVYINKKATYGKAIDYLSRAIPLLEKVDNKPSIVIASGNLGEVYFNMNRFDSALHYYEVSLKASENKEVATTNPALNNIGKVYAKMGEFNLAIQYLQRAFDLAKKLNAKLYMSKSLLGLAETYKDKEDTKNALSYYKQAEEIADEIHATYELKDAYAGLASSYAVLGDYGNAYTYQTLFSNIKDTLYNATTDKKLGSLQFDFDLQKKQGEINLLVKDKELTEVEIKRQRVVRLALIIGLVLVFITAFAIYRNYRIKAKTNKILDKQKVQIENLLLNILPSEVAQELQATGKATPRHYESVSVLFTDFKGFTTIADKMTPGKLVEELNDCFMAFDNIIERNELEKIKTIGDSYMCAGGIPGADAAHPYKIVKAGLEIQQYIHDNNERRKNLGLEVWDIRIGIHIGPVVAGVVGKKKYAYDIWGSTVNIASRMESNGHPGQVNISSTTYELVKDKFACSHRGKIYAKNVGEIDMYFVEGEFQFPPNKETERVNKPGEELLA